MNDPAMGEPDHPADDARVDLFTRDFTVDTLVAVRHDVERCAAQHGLTGLALYRFVVAVNELTTNAVRHGGGSGQLSLWRTGNRLHCRVADHGPGLSTDHQIRQPPAHVAGGRGLWLAHHGVERLTVDSDFQGTSITATTPL
jgi:anti-sigma regulatory factor (Ser/Thr protein kinase)